MLLTGDWNAFYLVFNDAGMINPVNLPNAGLQELYYFNNSISIIRSAAPSAPPSFARATIMRGHNNRHYVGYIGQCVDRLRQCENVVPDREAQFQTTLNITICQGDNYAGYTSSGTYVDVFTAANGCDSTRTLH